MKKAFQYIISIGVIFVLWEVFSVLFQKAFFPSPIETVKSLMELIADGTMGMHILASTKRILAGTLWGFLAALPVGLLLGCSEKVDAYVGNIFNILYPIPKVVFLPIIVVCMGIGDEPKIFLIALVIFFQLTLNIRDAVRHISMAQINSMRTLNPSKIQYFAHLVIPACLPEILSGLRSTIGISTALLFITENFASITGLGYFITSCMDTREYASMYAGILTLALLGVILYGLLHLMENYVCKWKYIEKCKK